MPHALDSIRLDLDAATRLYLPEISHEGSAQSRFPFRLEDGREEWLLARLARLSDCAFKMGSEKESRSFYGVVLRPENAESERIFVCEAPPPSMKGRQMNLFLTQEGAQNFDWENFPPFLLNRGEDYAYAQLWRFWSTHENGQQALFRLDSLGRGETCDVEQGLACGIEVPQEHFRWQSQEGISDENRLLFLREETVHFHQHMEGMWHDPASEMSYTRRWQTLTHREKEEIAFECQHGQWSELKRIASYALRMRLLSTEESPDFSRAWPCCWEFASELNRPWFYVNECKCRSRPFEEASREYLRRWRDALIAVFRPKYLTESGIAPGIPVCLEHFIRADIQNFEANFSVSRHEILEAQMQLKDWAFAHFPPAEAQQLLLA